MECERIAWCPRGEAMRQRFQERFKTAGEMMKEMNVTDTITIQTPEPQEREKTKVTDIDIIVDHSISTEDKIYYRIKYKVAGENEYHIGYGSYDLKLVQEWFDKEFEKGSNIDEEGARNNFIHRFCGNCCYSRDCTIAAERCPKLKDALKIVEG